MTTDTVTPGATLAWRVHLFAERPGRGWMAIGIMAGVLGLLHFSGNDGFIPFAFVIFFISLAPFFFPTHYELTPEGVTRRIAFVTTRRRWKEFPRYYHDDEGVKLSIFPNRSRREPFRGISVPSQHAAPSEYRKLASVVRANNRVLQATPNALTKSTVAILGMMSTGVGRNPGPS